MTRSRLAVRVIRAAGALLLLGVAGCAGGSVEIAGRPVPAGAASDLPPETTAPAPPPPEPTPARDAPCPYLDDDFVEQTNGQRVGKTAVSAEAPHPACFFYRSDGREQLRIQVLVNADPATARALVDRAAPVSTSDPAQLPGGWDGGKQPTESGAVFAVHKAGAAIVVVGNQKQTIKVSRVAEQVIAALGL